MSFKNYGEYLGQRRCCNLSGSAGPKGDAGPPGPQGDTGPGGETGYWEPSTFSYLPFPYAIQNTTGSGIVVADRIDSGVARIILTGQISNNFEAFGGYGGFDISGNPLCLLSLNSTVMCCVLT